MKRVQSPEPRPADHFGSERSIYKYLLVNLPDLQAYKINKKALLRRRLCRAPRNQPRGSMEYKAREHRTLHAGCFALTLLEGTRRQETGEKP